MRDKRRSWISTLGLLAAAAAVALLAGCRQPPWELRAYHADSTGGVFTDSGGTSTWQYAKSTVEGRYVCPYCGYSTAVVATPGGTNWCPNPFGVGSHPGNVNLQFQPIDRCFLSTTGIGVTHPSGVTLPAVVGRPFHPRTGDDVIGSTVRLAASGMASLECANVVANNATGDSCRFLVVEPGARFPSANLKPDATTGLPAMGNTADAIVDDIGITAAGVHLNPYRVTDGEIFHVQRYSVASYDNNGLHLGNREAIRVYSNLDGLIAFFYGNDPGGASATGFSLEAGDGSVRLDIPQRAGVPANGPRAGPSCCPCKLSSFQVVSNSQLIPGLHPDPVNVGAYIPEEATADPLDWTAVPPSWPWDGSGTPVQDWPTKASYFRIPTAGLVADWLSNVVGSGALLVNPYVIPPAAVGKGWVIAEWQKAGAAGIITAGPTTKQTALVGATNWYWDEGAEWNYDWLVETGGPGNVAAAPTHLWANSNACANVAAGNQIDGQTDLTAFHTEGATPTYQATNPVPYFITSFVSSRLQVPPTGQLWDKDGTGASTPALESDTDPGRGTATLLIGEQLPSGNMTGSYEPGTSTVTRQAVVLNRMTAALRCPACGSVETDLSTTICKYCGAPLTATANLLPGDAVTAVSVQDPPSLSAPSPRRPAAFSASRPALTEDALASSTGTGLLAPWQVPAAPVPSPLPLPWPYPFSIGFDLPAYLAPSAPMAGTNPAASDLINDPGYFGRLVLVHRPQFYPGQAAGSTEATPDPGGRGIATPGPAAGQWTYNHRWDVGYRSPSSGAWQAVPGASADPADPGYNICPVCAIPVPTSVNTCPYCGHTPLFAWTAAATFAGLSRVTAYDLGTEEYEPFNVVVSVLRKLNLSRTMAALDLGRVAPGVPQTAPDTTVGGSSVDPVPAPSDVTTPDRGLPGRHFDVLNEGNVWAPLSAGSVQRTDLVRAGTDTDFGAMSYHERVASVPLPWNVVLPFGLGAGLPAGEAGGAAGGDTTGFLQAGIRVGVTTPMPIPLGQPAGVHTGRVIVFTDLTGPAGTPDGYLSFYRPGLGVVTTQTVAFDPTVDLPLEPVADLDVRLRVAEGRLPQDDYFSADVAPTIAFDLGPSGAPTNLHLVWMGNRAPAGNVGSVSAPGSTPADLPATTSPFNLLYANAGSALIPDVFGNETYRNFEWAGSGGLPSNASALTTDAVPGTINESPFVLPTAGVGGVANNLALWHRLLPTANGWESTLRFNQSTAPDYSGAGGYVFASSRDMQGLKAIYYGGMPWLFWHAGAEGQQQIYSLPNFDPAAPAPGVPVPVSLALGSSPHHERTTIWAYGGSGVAAHRFAASAFTYTRDPSVWLSTEYTAAGSEPILNVLFTGYVRGDENTDICWAKFLASDTTLGSKKYFPRLRNRVNLPGTGSPAIAVGEELRPDSRRQYFSSQHLEWVCHDVSDVDNFAVSPNAALEDTEIFVGLATSGATPTYVYSVTWTNGSWSRERNAYYVQPRFTMIYPTSGADPLFTARALAGEPATAYRVIDPSTANQATPQSLTMEINAASGTVRFSAPLFDAESPGDPMAVLNSANMVTATDLQVYANYTPTIWRITRDPAADDCPWAFWSPNDTGSLVFFWRRSYSSADTPFEGRSVFMYRQWAPSVQVRRPPVTGSPTVSVSYDNGGSWNALAAGDYDRYDDTGYIVFHDINVADESGPNQVPFLVRVTYTGAGSAAIVDEQHLAMSWTQERRVPIDAEVAAGPLSVAHESYAATVLGGTVTVGRFWLAWSSPRSLLDLRPAGGGGGGALRQSADVYLASVVPTLSTAVSDPHTCSLPVPP